MKTVDISENHRIPIFMQMGQQMSAATKPDDVLNAYISAIARAYGPQSFVLVSCKDLAPGKFHLLRFLDHTGRDRIPYAGIHSANTNNKVHSAGLLSQIVRTPEPKLLHEVFLKNDPVMGDDLVEYGSIVAVPLFLHGEPSFWLVMLKVEAEGYTADDLEATLVRCNFLESTLANAMMSEELTLANARINLEVEHIAEIQHALLPSVMPDIPGLTLAAHYETFDRAGGDYYDFIPLLKTEDGYDPNGPWGIVIADASGHGPAAAVVMAMVHALFNSYDDVPESPAEVIQHINRNLKSNLINYAFVTAFFGIYNPKTRVLRYVLAGHEAPILMRPGHPQEILRLNGHYGFPLGVCEDVGCVEESITLEPGHTIVLYTDGITEGVSPQGEMFQVEGIEKALVQCNGKPDCVIEEVVNALKLHEAGQRSRDDQAIVVLHAQGGDES